MRAAPFRGALESVEQVVVRERSDAEHEEVLAGLEHGLTVLADRLLPCPFHDHVERLSQKSVPVSGYQHVGRCGRPGGPNERRCDTCVTCNASADAGLHLAGDRAVADEADAQRLCDRTHSAASVSLGTLWGEVPPPHREPATRYDFVGREVGWTVDKLRVNTFGRSALHETAVKEGIYAAEDLEVEHAATQSSKAQMQELKDGVWDVVHTNADNVFFWNEDNGADFLIILASPGLAGQDFVVRPEIESYEQLRGKALAVDASESGYATPLRVLLGEAGLKQEGRDYWYLEVGAGGARVDALRDGRASGAMLGSSQAAGLAAEGFRILDSINRLYTHYAGAAAVRRRWAEERSDLLVRYLRTVILSGERGGASDGRGTEGFDWTGLGEMIQMRHKLGLLRGPVDPHRFADDSYYNRAAGSLQPSGKLIS